MKKTTKLRLDKYYTPKHLAQYVVDKTNEIIGTDNITEYIEPSAGSGVFLPYLNKTNQNKPYQAYDIEPEHDEVAKQDYLQLGLLYRPGRCIIGNPPFGERNNLSVKFFKKAIHEGDYISFILPISQLNNNMQMYEFDLTYSENLGVQEYSDREVRCCLNIYRRPKNGVLNKRPNYKLKDVELVETTINKNPKRHKEYHGEYDLRINAWGAGAGETLNKDDKKYAKEFYIIIHNDKLRDKIIDVITNAKWEEEYPMTATPNLLHWQVYKYLKKEIPEIE